MSAPTRMHRIYLGRGLAILAISLFLDSTLLDNGIPDSVMLALIAAAPPGVGRPWNVLELFVSCIASTLYSASRSAAQDT